MGEGRRVARLREEGAPPRKNGGGGGVRIAPRREGGGGAVSPLVGVCGVLDVDLGAGEGVQHVRIGAVETHVHHLPARLVLRAERAVPLWGASIGVVMGVVCQAALVLAHRALASSTT